jgi:hypothetical protein
MAALLEARRVAVAQEIAQLQAVSEQIESLTQKLHDCDVARAPAWPVCEGLSPAAGTR